MNLVAVSTGWRWGAVGIGLGVLVLLYLLTIVGLKQSRNPWKLVEGADGSASTSKLQWFLWLAVIIFAYTALWVLRAVQGDYSAINQVPVNLLTVLGFSTGTAAAAKGITSMYVQSGRITKPPPTSGSTTPGILVDDSGVPELAKIQMMGFTIIAIGIFLTAVIHQLVSTPVVTTLPNIDSSLLVLMGISQGGYLGKKLVTSSPPTLYPPKPPSGQPGDTVTLDGANLGAQATSQLTLNDAIIDATWSASGLTFTVPATNPARNDAAWTAPSQQVQLAVVVMGQPSNAVNFTVIPPAGQAAAPAAPKPPVIRRAPFRTRPGPPARSA